jgi:hypothetical protein
MRPSTLLTLFILSFATNFGPAGVRVSQPATSTSIASTAEDYEALLMSSVKGWDDFQKRFKKATNVTMATEGSETVLRGTIEAYDVKNSTFEARFASPTRITRLVVTLDPVNAKDRRLRSDLSSKFAKGQPDLECAMHATDCWSRSWTSNSPKATCPRRQRSCRRSRCNISWCRGST